MNLISTLSNFDGALSVLLREDAHLLEANLSERSIAHRLALYLTCLFPEFDVDCEYNGDLTSEGLRKILKIPQEVMEELVIRKIRQNDTYNIFPDIIIHKRKSNESNHVVIEMKKKDTNHREKEYDFIKLKEFTKQYRYNLGIYLEFQTGENSRVNEVRFFQNGEEKIKTILEDF